jgi:hypothetical protein
MVASSTLTPSSFYIFLLYFYIFYSKKHVCGDSNLHPLADSDHLFTYFSCIFTYFIQKNMFVRIRTCTPLATFKQFKPLGQVMVFFYFLKPFNIYFKMVWHPQQIYSRPATAFHICRLRCLLVVVSTSYIHLPFVH